MTDLGFDTNIKRIGEGDFDVSFTIQQTEYHASRLLSHLGAEEVTGRGTRVFEVKDREGNVRVIKDSWIEDRPGTQVEHEIAAEIRDKMGNNFSKYFVNICGHHKTDTSRPLRNICEFLERGAPKMLHAPHLLVPAPDTRAKRNIHERDNYKKLFTGPAPQDPPHPRFRYQVVYEENGTSLFEVTPFPEVINLIGQAADGM